MNERKNKKTTKRTAQPAIFPQASSCFTAAIVGGGASGIAAACMVAAFAHGRGIRARVVLIEKGRKIGSSILRSGNGRCNFSHVNIQSSAFNEPSFVDSVFESLENAFATDDDVSGGDAQSGPASASRIAWADLPHALSASDVRVNAVLRWFFELGLVWQVAPHTGGLLYPFSNKASSVLEVLQAELDRCGVEQAHSIEVSRISKENGRFSLQLQDALDSTRSDSFAADTVVFAAGGKGPGLLRSSGFFDDDAFARARCVLGPLRTETRFLEGLDGIRVRARLSCADRSFSEEGEVLFRTYGVSGIVVFNASRVVEEGDTITLDLAPDLSLSNLNEMLVVRAESYGSRAREPLTYSGLLRGFFLPELADALVRYSAFCAPDLGIAAERTVQEGGIAHIAACIKGFEIVVVGPGDEKQSQVHRGGLRVDRVDHETMETVRVPGLYVTGETLDVDGPCGGYNLHWAWASGLLAGRSIARMLLASSGDSQGPERGER